MKISVARSLLLCISIVALDTRVATAEEEEESGLVDVVKLDKTTVRDCHRDDPCGVCQGDCDEDEDCAGNLVCFQKNRNFRGSIPGCIGGDASRTDFCVDPSALPEPVDPSDPPIFVPEEEPVATEAPEAPEVTTAAPEPDVVDPVVVPAGFEEGMAAEIAGFWIGDEKYNWEGDLLSHCSNAFFQPGITGNYLSWHGTYVGDNATDCQDIGVDPITGGIENDSYHDTAVESYLLGVGYKACITEADCTYDVTESEGFEDYDIIAKSCGVHLMENLLTGEYDCELYQISRLERIDNNEMLDVAVLTYGSTWKEGGFANFACPNQPTFDMDELMENEDSVLGTARFVRKLGYGSYEMTNLTDWECVI